MDERLSAAAALFPPVEVGADIGANHGLLTCHLLATGKAKRMWATDLSTDALGHARRNLRALGLEDRVSFAVGDGFSVITEPVQAAAILGMGGQTAAGIILSAPEDRLPAFLVLSTHTELSVARRSLYERGYEIREEVLVYCGGRYYVLMQAERTPGAQMPDERTLFLGPGLMRLSTETYQAYLRKKLSAYEPSRTPEGIRRCQWLREEAERAAADSACSP